jgi:hypothetical protein
MGYRARVATALILSALVVAAGTPIAARSGSTPEVVATGVSRPLQLATVGRALVVLSPGQDGDTAGEIHRIPLDVDLVLPIDLARQPRIRIPFSDARGASLGSLAIDSRAGILYLGEENGARIWRLSTDERLTLYATGLHRLPGGTSLVVDGQGRLVLVDNVDPLISTSEDRPPPGLEQFRDEDYRGPLVFRLDLDPGIPLPRRLGRLAPFFPRGWSRGGAMLPRFISIAATESGDLVLLSTAGELLRLDHDGTPKPFARLPRGQYNRISMVAAADGSILVSGGFHIGSVFRVTPDGVVTMLTTGLADPEGIATDADGVVYVAESALHRIVRLRPS